MPFVIPYRLINHELPRLPISPPTVYMAVTKPYRSVVISRQSGMRDSGG